MYVAKGSGLRCLRMSDFLDEEEEEMFTRGELNRIQDRSASESTGRATTATSKKKRVRKDRQTTTVAPVASSTFER